MEFPEEASVEAKLKALIRHLVRTFPQTSILSRQVGDTYHVFVIVPYAGGPEKAIQVERALLVEREPSVDEFGALLDRLNLSTVLQGSDRYELSHTSWPQTQAV